MEQTYQTFIRVLRSHLTGCPECYPRDTDWTAVADLAAKHSVQAMVYQSLRNAADVPREVLDKLLAAYHATVFRDAQFDHVRQELSRQLALVGAEHVFLRGICLKQDYPVPALRSMSDIDILVHTKDYDSIHTAMTAIGAELLAQDDNHRSYLFSGKVLVEFHPMLIRSGSVGAGINPGWQYTCPVEGSCERVMTREGFYLNVACHLAHHLASGGTGVRSVMDIWVCNHLRSPLDRAFVEKELERFGLLALIKNIEALADAWFSNGELTDAVRELGAYILTSGTYGTEQRLLLSNAYLSGGKWASARRKLFPSRGALEAEFPWCAGKGVLLPAAWTARLWNRARHGSGMLLLLRWGAENLSQSDVDIEKHGQRLRRFGLTREKE